MEHIKGTYFIKNNIFFKTVDFDPDFMQAGQSVYEVVRIIEGVPLFMEEHLERLKKSANIINHPLSISKSKIMDWIHLLAKQCDVEYGNVKLVLQYGGLDSVNDSYVFFIEHYYPS
jgi:branched-chain amino acid aminotransferase